MAFWGIEVKPGKPFTHTANDARGRLHISQATLGIGTATKKSVVQCNVGNKSPVFLCSLFPEKTESCQLNLEFEEVDEVVFSVLGPRSVHLTGYFLGSGRRYNLNDESESYGEDIADTETERSASQSDEDNYEDSFIDDSDPKLFPPSPLSDGGEIETPDKRKPKNMKDSHRRLRLRKKYQLSESDDDIDAQEHISANGTVAMDIESDDMLPISSIRKGTSATWSGKLEAEETIVEKNGDMSPVTNNTKMEAEEKSEKKSCETSYSDLKDEGHCFTIAERKVDAIDNGEPKRLNSGDSELPSVKVDPESSVKPKKKKRARSKEGTNIDTDDFFNVLKGGKPQENDTEVDKTIQNLSVRNENYQQTSNGKGTDLPVNIMPPSVEVGPESHTNPKKRKRKDQAEEKSFEADSDYHTKFSIEDNIPQDELKPNSMGLDLPVRNEQNENQADDKIFDNKVQSTGENQPKEKKKKKKSKTNEDGKVKDIETPLPPRDERSGLVIDTEKSADSKLSQVRTLSNGVVIEELEKGKPDGKLAASGKKISVLYIGKLKENGLVFESNLGSTPFKFRLGGGKDVIDGFNVGLEGMQVGEKRRILIPPSMGYGSEGDGKNVPPNSSLVFDVELVKVHR